MNLQVKLKKKFCIHTLGCKVNQYESQAMRELLVRAGLEESEDGAAADICVINTCTVTEEADRESKNIIARLHRAHPNAGIVATGCLAEKDSRSLLAIPGVSHVLKNSEKNNLAQALGIRTESARGRPAQELVVTGFKGHSKAYVKIQDGCENGCSYCKVPLVRSRLKSKPIEDIAAEVSGLVRNGFKEIILTGICLGAWGNGSLVNVLRALEKSAGDFRIRLSSIEPKYVTDELIDFMSASKRICAHLHIPFQSGDDSVLRSMNRPYTSTEYKEIAGKVRSKIPQIALTTDILIGFPGETPERFGNTVDFVREAAPSRTHIFTFSKREGTPAYNMPGMVDKKDLKERYAALSAVASESALVYSRNFIGKVLEVLVENKPDKATGFLKGYTGNYMHVMFAGPDNLMRKVAPVKIIEVNTDRIIGKYE